MLRKQVLRARGSGLGARGNGPQPTAPNPERYLVGGVNSPVRAFRHVGGKPLILASAQGATVVDAEGRSLTDFIMGWGANILGHNPPAVLRALQRQMRRGVLLGLTHEAEAALAQRIVDAVPSVEQVRFTVSGSEACLVAVRLARAATTRDKILLFEGCYHGHGDSLIVGYSSGLPEALASHVVAVPFNDAAALTAALRREGERVACVIIEPVAANMGVVPPQPEFLQHVRELTKRYGILLIFDEVVTGFRLGRGGAQGHFGVTPDLTTFGKIIGGGLPIGAVGGPRRLMSQLAPEGPVYHGGTFAGHPLSMAAGCAVLDRLAADPPYGRLARLMQRLVDGLSRVAQRAGVPVTVNALGSMAAVFFSAGPVRSSGDVKASDRRRFASWANSLRQAGVLVAPSPFEALFLSSAHGTADVDRLVRASEAAMRSLKT